MSIASLIKLLKKSKVIALCGNNFTGRSSILRQIADSYIDSVYIGAELYNGISGIMFTVEDELELYGYSSSSPSYINQLIEASGLRVLFERDPFSLSGGEQASLVLICALLLGKNIVLLDSVFEQLSYDLRYAFFKILFDKIEDTPYIIFTDNRLEEIPFDIKKIFSQNINYSIENKYLHDFKILNSEPIRKITKKQAKLITLEGITFQYSGKRKIFNNLNFTFNPNEVYVLTGKNGVGKSTLAKILVGVLKPIAGSMKINNNDFKPWDSPANIVGYHFQNPDLQLFETSIIDEVSGNKMNSRLDTSNVLNAFGLEEIDKIHPLSLSIPFVLRKRIALAATINMNVDWIFLDEPTLVQDDISVNQIIEMVNILKSLGRGIIIITHSQTLISRLSAKKLILDEDGLHQI